METTCSTQIKSSVMFQPAFIFLFQVASYRRRWQEFGNRSVDGCPALPSPSAAAEGTLCTVTQHKTALFNLRPRPNGTAVHSGVREPPAGRSWWSDKTRLTTSLFEQERRPLVDRNKSRGGIFLRTNAPHYAGVLQRRVFVRFRPCQTEFTGCLFSLEQRTGSRV